MLFSLYLAATIYELASDQLGKDIRYRFDERLFSLVRFQSKNLTSFKRISERHFVDVNVFTRSLKLKTATSCQVEYRVKKPSEDDDVFIFRGTGTNSTSWFQKDKLIAQQWHTEMVTFNANHTGENPYHCDVCRKSFLSVSYLNRHKLIHAGEKSFRCEICARKEETVAMQPQLVSTGVFWEMGIRDGASEYCGSKMKVLGNMSDTNETQIGRQKKGCEISQQGKQSKEIQHRSIANPKTRVAFQQRLLVNLQNKTPTHLVEENWNQLKETIITACEETIGRKIRKHQDWFDDNDEALKELIDQKRKAFISLQNDPKSATKRESLKKCKSAVERTTRNLKNQWWRHKSREIQKLADVNDTRGFFKATKEIYGPSTHGQAPLKSQDGATILKSNTEIGDRWREHFDDLLNHKATIDKRILDMIPKDYYLARIPSLEEVKIAITAMKNNKAAGPDGIPAEIYKLGVVINNGKVRQGKQSKEIQHRSIANPKTRVAFQQRLLVNLQNKTPTHLVEENWNQLKETIITACEETIGRKIRKHQDWFDDNDEALKELIDQKRKAFISLQNDPKSATKRESLKKCKSAVERTTRNLKNQWWRHKSREIQRLLVNLQYKTPNHLVVENWN
ncbi:development 2-like [Octopus vulgaris]|uniref:Development 2-like n=1 Tax=Octopus vulgaris TaxID=6645 RepID=A0AA36C1C5_OCTVU|nr:development 2-like [Octopus vulgaris]